MNNAWDSYVLKHKQHSVDYPSDVWSRKPYNFTLSELNDIIQTHFTKDDIVLEIGCGDGRITQMLDIQCASVIAMDTSAEMLQLAKQRIYTNVVFTDLDLQTIVTTFNYTKVLIWGVFQHLTAFDIFQHLHILGQKDNIEYIFNHHDILNNNTWSIFVNSALDITRDETHINIMTKDIMKTILMHQQFTIKQDYTLKNSIIWNCVK